MTLAISSGSWNAPVGRGLHVDFGKYVTHLGYEVIQGYDGWNDNFSRSFLFGYAIPFTHTGLRLGYAGEKASVSAMVVNGWDNVKDNNGGKSMGAQILLTPSKAVSFYVNWMGGPERADSSDRRDVFNPILVLKPGRFVLAADYVYGHEKNTFGPGLDVTWQGFAGYIRLNPSSRVGLTVRGEVFDDEDGARTGVVQKLKEVTFTPEVRCGAGSTSAARPGVTCRTSRYSRTRTPRRRARRRSR
jgi:Putative beta-barrel porin-2, OmpL-like. bbp2